MPLSYVIKSVISRKMNAVKSLCQIDRRRSGEFSQPVVVRSSVSLSRNFLELKFPNAQSDQERALAYAYINERLRKQRQLNRLITVSDITRLECLALQERGLLPGLSENDCGLLYSESSNVSVILNGADHICIQATDCGKSLKETFKKINALDNKLDDGHYAFSPQWGYLTADPMHVGTGLCTSVILHLPGMVEQHQIDFLIRALQQININLEPYSILSHSEHFFQLSNQQTLGIQESEELRRIEQVIETIIEQEFLARVQLQQDRIAFLDRLGHIYGILRSGYLLSEKDAVKMLSWMRLAADLRIIEEKNRSDIDQLMIDVLPGNLCVLFGQSADAQDNNRFRAEKVRQVFHQINEPR